MSDAIHRFVVTMPCVTGLPEDKTENVFSVGQNGVLGASDLTDAIAAVRDFYITAHAGQVNAVGKYIGQSVSRTANACTVSLYSSTDLTGATPFGSPTNITAFTMSSVLTSNALPEEVAAVISYGRVLNMRELFGRSEGVVDDVFFEANAQYEDSLLIIVNRIGDSPVPRKPDTIDSGFAA